MKIDIQIVSGLGQAALLIVDQAQITHVLGHLGLGLA